MSDVALPDATLRALLRRDRAALADQSAAGQGYVLNVANVQRMYEPPATLLAVPTEGAPIMAKAHTDPNDPYIPDEDVTETLADGRVVQIAAKGVPVPYAEAVRRGLIKPAKSTGPSEVKSQADYEQRIAALEAERNALRAQLDAQETARVNAQAAEAMRENTGDAEAEAPSVARAEAEQQAADEAAERQRASAKAAKGK